MSAVQQMAALAAQMQTALPGASVDFTEFPSGSAMLDIRHQGHLYVMSYSPSQRFGVDEVMDAEGFLTSYRFTSDDFEQAAQRLWEVVAPTEAAQAG